MREVKLTSLNNEPHNKMMEAVMETDEHMILEELWYKIEDTYFTRTEIVQMCIRDRSHDVWSFA